MEEKVIIKNVIVVSAEANPESQSEKLSKVYGEDTIVVVTTWDMDVAYQASDKTLNIRVAGYFDEIDPEEINYFNEFLHTIKVLHQIKATVQFGPDL